MMNRMMIMMMKRMMKASVRPISEPDKFTLLQKIVSNDHDNCNHPHHHHHYHRHHYHHHDKKESTQNFLLCEFSQIIKRTWRRSSGRWDEVSLQLPAGQLSHLGPASLGITIIIIFILIRLCHHHPDCYPTDESGEIVVGGDSVEDKVEGLGSAGHALQLVRKHKVVRANLPNFINMSGKQKQIGHRPYNLQTTYGHLMDTLCTPPDTLWNALNRHRRDSF